MLRPFVPLCLAFVVPLASLPVCAGGFTPTLTADPVGSFLGVSVVLYAVSLLARAIAPLARRRMPRNGE